MLEARQLAQVYGSQTVLDRLSFSVAPGEVLGVVGPNGAGKSTLLSLLAGISRPSSGDILLNGRSILREPRAAAGLIGYVPQEIALHTTLTVRDNLSLFGRLAHLPSARLQERMAEVLEVVGLQDRVNTRVSQLSGGMKRKLNIAVALLADPQLLIMDEPTVGIDIKSAQEIIGCIRCQAERGRMVVYTSHHADEIQRLCQRVLVLNQGELRFAGTLDEARQCAAERLVLEVPTDWDQVFSSLGEW